MAHDKQSHRHFSAIGPAAARPPPALAATPDPWPKRFEDPKGTVVMYQPQMEDFKDDVLTGRAAISVKKRK